MIKKKNLLSKKVFKRVALTSRFSNNSLKVPKGFKRLTKSLARLSLIGISLFFLSGYYPVWDFPPVKSSAVFAQENEINVQKAEIIASSFPQPVILPHEGYLSTKFSRFHPGVDIATPLGTSVHPINQGTVEEATGSFWGYGNHVIVSHPNGFKSLYGHMGKMLVKKGQDVTTDTTLGEVGMTGISSGPHTHLEVTLNGEYIDPLLILPEISDIPKSEFLSKKQSLLPKQ